MTSTISQFQDATAPECVGAFLTTANHTTKNVAVIYGELSDDLKAVYDAFIDLAADKGTAVIENTPVTLEVTHPVIDALDEGSTSLDYTTMSQADKTKVDNFINLLNEL